MIHKELIYYNIIKFGKAKMAHIIVPEAEKILDKEIKVLDHGFVRLVDYMGSDARIVQTARVSYGEGTKTLREDAGLIDYLLRHEHTSPFEHVIFEFHAKMPIFVARQWIRHRTARLNEISGRYSVIKDEFYVPDSSSINFQNKDNKQGRAVDDVPDNLKDKVISILSKDQETVYKNYEEMIDDDIARELARINLPLSTYTEWYWQMDLKNMFHFLKLRMDHHAQWEIQEYGRAMAKIVKAVCPLAYESFEKHMVNGARFSEHELNAIRLMLDGKENLLEGRRLKEFEQKLNQMD